MIIPDNHGAPHRAIIWVRAEIHELTPRGECTGRPVNKIETFPVYIDGCDRDMAIRKLSDIITELKNTCKQHQS